MQFLRKLHKWLGLIVGVQVLLWAVSGLVFAWLDHGEVTAKDSVRAVEPAALAPGTTVTEPAAWLGEYRPADVYEVRLVRLLDRWAWRIELADRVELRDAIDDGRVVLTNESARRLALAHYAGGGKLQEVTYQPSPDLEARHPGPAWRVRFDDDARTTLYFAADDGRLVAARNASWRLFDFFWMLHTMDYRGRDDFNNPLVILFGTAALWLSLSGLVLLLHSFRLA